MRTAYSSRVVVSFRAGRSLSFRSARSSFRLVIALASQQLRGRDADRGDRLG